MTCWYCLQREGGSESFPAVKDHVAADDDGDLSLPDLELETAVRLIERDPVVTPNPYPFTINNDQICAPISSGQYITVVLAGHQVSTPRPRH